MTDPRPHLRALADALPPGSVVPVPREWLLELLGGPAGGLQTSAEPGPRGDLTVAELAQLEGRQPSTVRGWLERGDFPGAYRLHGREWRVPPADYASWQERQRKGGEGAVATKGAGGLGGWRTVRAG